MKTDHSGAENSNESNRNEQNEDSSDRDSAPVPRRIEQVVAAVSTPFDVLLVPEYDGTTDVEWFTRATLICEMKGGGEDLCL